MTPWPHLLRISAESFRRIFLLFLLLAGMVSGSSSSVAEIDGENILLTGASGIVPLPAELVADSTVERIVPSPDRRSLLLFRGRVKVPAGRVSLESLIVAPPFESSIVLWDSRRRESCDLWRSDGQSFPEALEWLPGSRTAVALVTTLVANGSSTPPSRAADAPREAPSEPVSATEADPNVGSQPKRNRTLLRITVGPSVSASRATPIPLPVDGEESDIRLEVSPTRPTAVAWIATAQVVNQKWTYRKSVLLIDETKPVPPPLALPEANRDSNLEWDSNGAPFVTVNESVAGSDTPSSAWYALDAQRNELMRLDTKPATWNSHPGAEGTILPVQTGTTDTTTVQLKMTGYDVKEKDTSARIRTIWLEATAGDSRIMLCADCEDGQLLDEGRIVVYKSRSSVWAAPLLEFDRSEAERMRAQARQAEALNRGKQVALALIMYMQDFNQQLPKRDELNLLSPYLKDVDPFRFFQGVTLTYSGTDAITENPSQTEWGYVTGPGGRAVIYADGHVKWHPD